ncbi:MAG: DUF1127 domain-containing protein [Proteobacteria bacterium]|nr:DUF1127 domain-containing protein [Pseudomonadota bacterium]
MRSYAQFEASAHDAGWGGGLLVRWVRNWRAHRAVVRLGDMDDRMLRDIGVSRDDLQWARALPLSVNAVLALEERGRLRRQGAFRKD